MLSSGTNQGARSGFSMTVSNRSIRHRFNSIIYKHYYVMVLAALIASRCLIAASLAFSANAADESA